MKQKSFGWRTALNDTAATIEVKEAKPAHRPESDPGRLAPAPRFRMAEMVQTILVAAMLLLLMRCYTVQPPAAAARKPAPAAAHSKY
jgi:hypothetical protein